MSPAEAAPARGVRLRQKLTFAARWAIGVGVVVVLAWTLDLDAVLGVLAAADPAWVAAGLGLTLIARVLHAHQLALAIRHHGIAFSVRRALEINLITAFYGFVLPGQIATGVLRWYRISKDSGKGPEALATVMFLRLLNSLVILVLGVLAILTDRSLALGRLSWGALGIGAALLALSTLLFTRRGGAMLDRRQRSLLEGAGSLRPALGNALRALRDYRRLSRREALRLAAVPVAALFLTALAFAAASRALDLRLPFPSLCWLVPLVYFVSMIPATVSGLGLREGALVFLLPFYGVGRADALAFSLVLFGYSVALGLAGGVLEVREAFRRPSSDPTPAE